MLLSVMSVAVWRRQYISDRQTQHGGFGGGDNIRRGKVRARNVTVLLSLSVSVAPINQAITPSKTFLEALIDC